MPDMERARSSTVHSEGSREASAESSNASPKALSPKDTALLETEVAALSKALSAVSNDAARIVTRRHWRKCLIGTEKDQSYLVRAILKHSTPRVYVRAMEDHGDKLLQAASDKFLDRALELRLKTVDAEVLIAMLAKSKRLGYDEEDAIDEDGDVRPAQNESSAGLEPEIKEIPNSRAPEAIMVDRSDPLLEEQNRNAIAAAKALATPYQRPASTASYSQNMNLPTRRKAKDPASRKFVCPDCNASFAQQGGLVYHIERKVCHRPAPQFRWFCRTCGKGFTTSGGKLYHEQNKVCEAHEIAKATPPTAQLQQGPVIIKPMPSPNLADGLPSPGRPVRQPLAHTPSLAGPSYQQVPDNRPVQYKAIHDIPRSTPNPSANTALPWPSQKIELRSQPAIPHYQDLRASIGSSVQTTPGRSSPGSERTPGGSPVLGVATQAELDAKMAAEVARFEKKCREVPDSLSAADREEVLNREKRGHATRKSQIRKRYGIRIRTSKHQPANFVRLPGQGDAPILAPLSRIAAFTAPAAHMIPTTYAISTPTSIEQGRERPIVENPDPKRRRLENSPPLQQISNSQARTDSYGIPGGLQRRMSAQLPETLEVVDISKSELSSPTVESQAKIGPGKVPKKVQWENLPREPSPSAHPTVLRDISNAASKSKPQPQKSKNGAGLVVITSKEASDSGSEDSDINPDEDIPARVPAGTVRRHTRSATGTASLSASPAPVSTARRTGSGLFSPSAAASRKSSETGSERRGNLGGARVRAVVQV